MKNILTVKEKIECEKNFGWGILNEPLSVNEYETTNLKIVGDKVIFSLYDDDGFIGSYRIAKKDFENKCCIF